MLHSGGGAEPHFGGDGEIRTLAHLLGAYCISSRWQGLAGGGFWGLLLAFVDGEKGWIYAGLWGRVAWKLGLRKIVLLSSFFGCLLAIG